VLSDLRVTGGLIKYQTKSWR